MQQPTPQTSTDSSLNPLGALRNFFYGCFRCICHQQEKSATPTRRMSPGAIYRSLIFAAVAVIGFGYLVHTLHKIQIRDHSTYESEVSERTQTTSKIDGKRGRIYDVNGNLLVGNLTQRTILLEPKLIPAKKSNQLLHLLASTLGLSEDDLRKKCEGVTQARVDVPIKCHLSNDNANLIDHWKLTGVSIIPPYGDDESYQLVISPRACTPKELDSTLTQLSPLTGLSVKDMKAQISKVLNKPKQITIARNIELATAEKLRKQLSDIGVSSVSNSKGSACIQITQDLTRCYAQGPMLASLLGYLDIDGKGVSGIEKLYENELKPTRGKRLFNTGGSGKFLPNSTITEIPPHNGIDIYLTIYSHIQLIADEALAKAVQQYNPERAYALMMNPKTGAIMALAQYPTYNPDDRASLKDASGLQLHCLFETYEPGSIMKSIPISYALDKGIVNLDTMFFCENRIWKYMGKTLKDTHTLGDTSVSDILMHSSNIGTAKIGLEMGPECLYTAFTEFGFGQPTHVGFLPENSEPTCFSRESRGILRALEKWDSLSPTRFPIGQGISCTPIQMLQAYSALANHGTMMHPYIIDKIVCSDGTVQHSVPRVKGRPISPDGARKITQALKTVVSSKGTGKRAALERFQVAGKTGTGQIWLSDQKRYAEHIFTGSFVGYVPADNPEFVLLVSLRHINVHGGTAGGPVFKEIAEKTLDYLETTPDFPEADSQDNKNTANSRP